MKNKRALWVMAIVGSMLTACGDNVTPTIKQKDLIPGIKFTYAYSDMSEQYYWQEYGSEAALVNYYYYDLGNSTDNKVTLHDPSLFNEYGASTLRLNTMNRNKKNAPKRAVDVIESEFVDGYHEQFTGDLTEDEFFAYTGLLTAKNGPAPATAGVKNLSMKLEENLDYVYWEIEEGYKSLVEDVQYKMYDNNYMIEEVYDTKQVAIDDEYLEHKEVKESSKGRTNIGKIDNKDYVISVMHKFPAEGEDEPVLGEGEKYPIPENYRDLTQVNDKKANLSDYYYFNMNSGLVNLMTKEYYNKKDKYGNDVFNKRYEWYASAKDEEKNEIMLQYNRNMEFDGIYSGQQVVDTVYVIFNSNNKVVQYGYDYVFYYFGEPLQAYSLTYDYSYESLGDYEVPAGEDELFDYNKYYDYGYLLPNLEHAKNSEVLDDKAEELLQTIQENTLQGFINEPTGAVTQTYTHYDQTLYLNSYAEELYAKYVKSAMASGQSYLDFETWYNTVEFDYDVEIETTLDSSLYNDNVMVSYYSEHGTVLDEYFYAESGTFQKFNQNGKTYEIRTYNGGTSRYDEGKITTDWETSKEPKLSLFDLDFSVLGVLENINYFIRESKKASSEYLVQVTAEKIPAGMDEATNEYVEEHYVITAQAVRQQQITEQGGIVGYILTYEIGFQIIK
ncbi:MAG: hypothetical protein J1F32_02145 [Erysipelotrichales bacterium]|nr:hypothetical protein [Erysipelotrichales bacterium]